MKVKGLLTAVVLVAAALLLQTTGFAVDLDYSGPINSFTGEPTSKNNTSQGQDRVPVTSGVYYDWNKRAYVFDLGGISGETVSANVMDGMVVNEAVSIAVSQGVDVRLHRNGNLVENADLTLIEDPGRYVLKVRLLGDQYVRVMDFTIVGETTCLVNSYPMPAGFVIKDVEMTVEDENGEWVTAAPQWDRSKVSMSENGNYRA